MHAKRGNNAKRSFPREAISRKYTFFQWILQNLRCDKYSQNGNLDFCNGSCKLPRAICRSRMPLFRRNGRASGALFEDLTSNQLAKLWLPLRTGSNFPKNEQHLAENCGLSNISGDGAAHDTRNAHPRMAISKKYTLSQWILQISKCNKYPK